MAYVLDGPVTPTDGTVLVRNVPAQVDASALDKWCPDIYTPAIELDFTVVSRRGNTARFRAHDAPAHVSPRDSFTMNRVPLLPITDAKPVIGEDELARRYGLAYVNDPRSMLAESIYDDLSQSAADIKRRAYQAKATVLSTGTLPVNEGGYAGTFDYGVPSGNKVTAPTLFNHQTSGAYDADIVGFFNTIRNTYIALNGAPPGKMLTTTPVLNLMQQNSLLRQAVLVQYGSGGLQGSYGGLMPLQAVSAIMGAYNLPDQIDICDAQVSVDGTNTALLPQNVIILGPADGAEVARFQWGPSITGQKMAASGHLDVQAVGGGLPGLIGFVDRGDDFPYKEQNIVDGRGIAAVTDANRLMILTVA